MSFVLLLACPSDEPAPAADTDPGADSDVPDFEPLFAFAVMADPHVTSSGEDHLTRTEAAVEWINSVADDQQIELVLVLGDIGWYGGLQLVEPVFDELSMPYVPIIGDNEGHFGSEEEFGVVFADAFAELEENVEDFRRGKVEIWNPDFGRTSWFYNLSFTYRGLHFLGLDWCSRDNDPILGEGADLHDFDEASWPWFQAEMSAFEAGESKDVLLFSHHPMHGSPGAFDIEEFETVAAVTFPLSGRIAGAWAGHYHVNWDHEVPDAGYDVFITDATWDDENTVRVVTVEGNGVTHRYTQELEIVPLR